MAMDSALRTALVISGYANWQWRLATHIYLPDTEERAFGAVGKRNDYFTGLWHSKIQQQFQPNYRYIRLQ